VPLRFVFALHNHQPVGNFGHVFDGAYRDSYWPFLELIEQYPDIPFALHTSGPLMEWLVERKPEYIDRLRRLVARGQVEIMGGGFYEPILPMIPSRDRIGQIRTYTAYLENLFQTRVRGMWVPERVWEQHLVSDIAAAGIEYTVLDDYHFRQAGLEEEQLFGYYLTEDEGRLLRVFPGSERMRYLVPFRNPEETIHYFGQVASRNRDETIVLADDGEKFGSWPETHKHCYLDAWLRRWLDQVRGARSWVRLCTFAQALDETPPVGKVYIPDCSYREMTEWALPVPKLNAYNRLVRELEHDHRWGDIQRFLRGGYWRNFKAKYPETQEMYARMLQVSRRVHQAEEADPVTVTQARQELYRAQCNCPWWHGAFGGLYLPHLRNAVYHHLIAAENVLLDGENRREDWLDVQTADLNLDGAPEVCLSNARLAAYFNPQAGGSLYELDLRLIRHNLLATLSRRPEAYHETIRRATSGAGPNGGAASIHDRVVFKQAGLDRLLQYDAYLRKSLLDHFYEPGLTLDRVAACRETELGDFVTGRYEHRVQSDDQEAVLTLQRSGAVAGQSLRLTKEVRLQAAADALEVRYLLENLPREQRFRFAVEFNLAGMAAGADDRYFYHAGKARAGQLQTLQDLKDAERIGLVDEWLGLDASLALSRRGGIWAFPVQTVSQSEGGFELVHQSTAVVPHWLVEPDAQGRWAVTVWMKLDVSRAVERMLATAPA
jgi:alpha-amylase